ncbi:MAG: CheR family methyltransferase [Gammaproteobacteria bacterium]|nr:CheR family methyltransferase [Gammaproteobacteria bacterium]
MNPGLSEMLLSQFSDFIAARIGLHFPRERWCDLERGISSAARDFALGDARACVEWLMSHPLTKREIEILASHLTVGETYFFREEKSFAALEAHILPELIRRWRDGEKRLRIWSAGCCTGEEPYSVAILLNRMIPDLDDWNLTLLATDINPHFLGKASNGVYNEWSFRATPGWVRERYFTKTSEARFELDPRIRRRVTFSYLNLAEDVYPSLLNNTNAMDVIFCRNVLMYFSPQRAQQVIRNLHRCLVDGGWLIVSPSEASHTLFSEFSTVNYPGIILYRKVSSCKFKVASPAPEPMTLNVELETLSSQPETASAKPETETPRPQQKPSYRQAQALYEQGCYDEVSEELQAVLTQEPGNTEAMTLLARTLANQGRLAEALAWCEKAVAAGKLNPASHYLLAIILQEQGQDADAVASLKRALYLDPDFALAHFALGNLVRRQGRHKESERHLQNALSILDKYPQEDRLPVSEGMTAGRLREIIRSMVHKEMAA